MAQEQDKLTPTATAKPVAPPPYPPDASSGRIKSDIAETRSEMDDTVDALAARLQPRHLLDDALDYFGRKGGSTSSAAESSGSSSTDFVKDAGSAALKKLRQHPLPAVLMAAGAAWLFLESDDDKVLKARARYRNWKDEPEMYSGSYVDARTGQPYDRATYGAGYEGGSSSGGSGKVAAAKDAASSAASKASGKASDLAGKASGAASSLADKASGVGSSITDAAGNLVDKAKGAASSLADTASDYAGDARDAAVDYAGQAKGAASSYASSATQTSRQAYEASLRKTQKGYAYSRDRFDDAMREYPVAVGVASLAAGLLAGLLVPRTRREDELFGDYSDDLKDQATDLGRHAWQETKHVAEATYDSAVAEAKKQGLTPEQLKQQGKQLADAAADQAEKHGLTADRLAETVKHAGAEVKSAAKDAKDAAADSADQAGATPSGIAGKVKSVIDAATHTAKEEAQHAKEDLTSDVRSKGEAAKETAERAKEDAKAKVS